MTGKKIVFKAERDLFTAIFFKKLMRIKIIKQYLIILKDLNQSVFYWLHLAYRYKINIKPVGYFITVFAYSLKIS